MKTPYYKEVLGGSEVHPKGKNGPFFYSALLKNLNLDPAEVLMIGDNYEAEAVFAVEAGITNFGIVDRNWKEDRMHDECGVLLVNSLVVCENGG